ncbi:MAG: hypothetical protein NWQ54_03855 [Paraglaciecola sp.]|nr:hypothetical protein [Paraglaciecola sp.]
MALFVTLKPSNAWQLICQQYQGNMAVDLKNVSVGQEPLLISAPQSLDSLKSLIEQQPQIQIIIGYSQADFAISEALQADIMLTDAVTQWLEPHQALLQVLPRYRRQVLLVNLQLLNSMQNVNMLQQQTGLVLTPIENDKCSLPLLIANQLLVQEQPIQDTLARLEASSVVLANDVKPTDDLAAFWLNWQKNEASLKQAQQQADTQLTNLQQQLAAKELQCQQLEANGNSLIDQLKASKQILDATNTRSEAALKNLEISFSAEKQTLVDENTLLLSQLMHLQEDLEKQLITHQQASAEMSKKQHLLEQQLTSLQREHTKANNENQSLSSENATILAQLLQLQEELEQQFNLHQQLKTENNKLQNEKQLQDTALNEQQQVVAKLTKELKQRAEQLSKAESQQQQVLTDAAKTQHSLEQQLAKGQQELNKTANEKQALIAENTEFLEQLMNVQQLLQTEILAKQESQQQLATLQGQHKLLQSSQTEVQAENSLLLSELLQVQEALESAYLQNQDESSKNKALLTQLSSVLEQAEQYHLQLEKSKHEIISREKLQKRETTRLQSQLRKAKAKADEATFKLENLQQDLKGIQNSKAWKVGAPVRLLSRFIHKEDKTKKQMQRDIGLIITSELFDTEWYLQVYPDVAAVNINPAEHYLRFGAAEGRRPGPDFDGEWYLQRYPDVAATGINPLLHFVKFGRNEGRTASPKLLEDHSE